MIRPLALSPARPHNDAEVGRVDQLLSDEAHGREHGEAAVLQLLGLHLWVGRWWGQRWKPHATTSRH